MNNETIKIGEKIQEIKDLIGMNNAELAKRLHTSRQNVARILSLDSIDTSQLYKISKILNHDFFQYYQIEPRQQNVDKKAKILIELELDSDEILKLGIKDRVLEIFNK